LAFLTGSVLQALPTSAANTQAGIWPAAQACTDCFSLQVWRMHLQLPRTEVAGIFSFGIDGLGIGLLAPGGDLSTAVFVSRRSYEYIQEMFKSRDLLETNAIRSAADYWRVPGQEPAAGNSRLQALRQIEGITTARRYLHYQRGLVSAYLVDSTEPADWRLYLLLEGDSSYYMFTGPMSETLLNAVLTHARLAPVP
jgi:hypothetical protein